MLHYGELSNMQRMFETLGSYAWETAKKTELCNGVPQGVRMQRDLLSKSTSKLLGLLI